MFNFNMLNKIPFHVIFIAMYPILFLYSTNINELSYGIFLMPMLLFVGIAVGLFLILFVVIKHLNKTGIITSIFLILFYTYGHIVQILFENNVRGWEEIFGFKIGVNAYMLPIYTVVFGYCLLRVCKSKGYFYNGTICLNVISFLLVVISLVNIVIDDYRKIQSENNRFEVLNLEISEGVDKPDIYYIFVDGYPRADILKTFYKYDNNPFLRQLESLNFNVFEKCHSNYSQTKYSVRSTFEMAYIEDHFKSLKAFDTENKRNGLNKANVLRMLHGNGYNMAAFQSVYLHTMLADSPYISSIFKHQFAPQKFNRFVEMVIRTTLANLYFKVSNDNIALRHANITSRRGALLYTLDTLDTFPKQKGPNFVFAHLLCPHVPIVFKANGEIAENLPFWSSTFQNVIDGKRYPEVFKEYSGHFNDQVTYLNTRIIQAVKNILDQSPTEPIIIIQSDHSDRIARRLLCEDKSLLFYNFTAIHMPARYQNKMPEDASNVNTFRYLFNTIFNMNLPILTDDHYYNFKELGVWKMEPLKKYDNDYLNQYSFIE